MLGCDVSIGGTRDMGLADLFCGRRGFSPDTDRQLSFREIADHRKVSNRKEHKTISRKMFG